MQFKINLSTRNYINVRKLNIVLFVTIIVLLVLLIMNVHEITFNAGEIKRISRETELLSEKSKTGAKGVSEAEFKTLLARISFANSVILGKSVNWLFLLDRLEEVVPDGVAISTIEPNTKDQMLKLSGSARTFVNLRRLLENVESSRYFRDVYLLTQGETKVGTDQKGINFTISCRTDYK